MTAPEGPSRRVILTALSGLGLSAASNSVLAQAWPSRPMRMIVPYPPGGASDVVARLITKQLASGLGTSVIVENRPGASTMIGAEAGARADPDGYTLLMASATTMSVVPTIYGARTPYDPARDFSPISLVSRAPFFVMVSAESDIKDLRGLIAQARQKPGQLAYGTNGPGGASHLGMLLFGRVADVQMVHVPYRSITTAATDLMGGRVATVLGDLSAVTGLVQAGQIRLIASASPERSPLAPDVPTVQEAAGVDIGDVGPWFGVFGPAKLPGEIVSRLNAEIVGFLAAETTRDAFNKIAQVPVLSTPDELSRLIRTDTDRYAALIRDNKITLD